MLCFKQKDSKMHHCCVNFLCKNETEGGTKIINSMLATPYRILSIGLYHSLSIFKIAWLYVRKGDSGGPMNFQQTDGMWMQIGVVSFGSNKGCEEGYPNGFTRVSSFASWIWNTTLQNSSSSFIGQPPSFLLLLWTLVQIGLI